MPFYTLIKSHMSDRGKYKPTISHYLQKLLVDKNKVQRIYTQNVDGLDEEAGIPEAKLIHAHGSFRSGTCMKCDTKYSFEWMQSKFKFQGLRK